MALTSAPGRAAETPSAARPGRVTPAGRRRRFPTTPYLFLLPGIVIFVVAIIWPAVSAFQMSLYKWNVFNSALSRWSGIDNYIRAFQDPHFWLSLSNSGIYMVATVIPQIVLGLGIALLLKRKSPSQAVFRVLFYLPVVTSWVVVSLLFKYLFDDSGLINFTLNDFLHLESSNTSWLAERWSALVVICLLGIWKGIGWAMMIYLAALQGVPESLEEAAKVDGANRWQRFRAVTVPAINPATVFISVMLVIGGLNVFTSVQLITDGGPIGQTDVVLTYMYTQAFKFTDFGYASSIAVILAVLVFILAIVQLRVMRRDDGEELS
ncbi:MAG TPA: sugar ABC transporter permease [Pseudolysinimonas sp.]